MEGYFRPILADDFGNFCRWHIVRVDIDPYFVTPPFCSFCCQSSFFGPRFPQFLLVN